MENHELIIPPLPSRRHLPANLPAERKAIGMLRTVGLAVAIGFAMLVTFVWSGSDPAGVSFVLPQTPVRF